MDLIKMEPNTDGEIQPTFFVSDVKEEQNCLTLLKAEGLHSMQLINLECDSNSGVYELASICDVTRDRPHIAVPIIFAPIKTETQEEGSTSAREWTDKMQSQDRVEQLVIPLDDVPESSSSGRLDSGGNYQQQGYFIYNLHSGDGGEVLSSQPGGVSEGIPSVKLDSNIDRQQGHLTCDLSNGNGEKPDDIPEGRSSAQLNSNVNCQQEYVTCDVCNGSGYLMHGLPVTRKINRC
ncbi:uncharacterized protein LOC111866924 [Cryptotermes secundus]|uniref:uncharacterized protein LOC111866924 n=1 Tax=Cryptotermes secundus TaxID=105785 RepID=UPI000CD7D4BB|nr:uncharacterized protein LOC111866924 [Cryptotermes secundus]XP_023712065.1 uncharacterized protein LOC111866924 [Cryptotermes secundus]XP_023712066.1 uncharacterized protein LOC111866924 [Cryptotermes secundus]XP_023712067.1 uncharacterized protein LOC111866924 [Cryptotermes secundus]XP_023712068.1 uncharacterized protein LOC111866924 [Cryptotermes secundus]XP_023712069.1 uncharacterized protein LOC111866924 [Cryptotermes secundus]